MKKPYIQHEGKAISADAAFSHVMAIALDPRTGYEKGVIRCITSRSGDIETSGYIDRSELHMVSRNGGESYAIGNRLDIKHEADIVAQLKKEAGGGLDFIGLEDPDIWIDDASGLVHLYFTMPFVDHTDPHRGKPHLGHAIGKDLDSLVMTDPALRADAMGGARELSIAPVNSAGICLNLVESAKREADFTYSIVRIALAQDMSGPWEFGDIVFHPKEAAIPWIGGHASPGPLFPKSFMDVGEGKLLGIMNGREANKKAGAEIRYGIFSVGLFIYDYEKGKIDWVSPEPFIRDSEAKTITFASQFVETAPGKGILYAHVDDSFVRAYTLDAEAMRASLDLP